MRGAHPQSLFKLCESDEWLLGSASREDIAFAATSLFQKKVARHGVVYEGRYSFAVIHVVSEQLHLDPANRDAMLCG